MYRMLTFLGIPTAFLLGFSLNVPDVQTPWHDANQCDNTAIEAAVSDLDHSVGQRFTQMDLTMAEMGVRLTNRQEKILKESMYRTSGSLRPRHFSQHESDQELKVIECSQSVNIPISSCDCWIEGRCEKSQTRRERFRQCYARMDDRNTCDCWVYDETPQGTLCRLFHHRDRCLKLETPELREECWNRWQYEKIPHWLYGPETE